MKKSFLLIVLITIAFYSCDRRGSAREHLQNSISEFNDKQTNLDLVAYYPETYTEIQTDSIISNTFKVSIKNYTKMDSQILVSSKKENNNTKLEYHRVFESEIRVAIASKTVFNTTINVDDFKDPSHTEFWNHATLEHVWVNQESSNSQELHLNVSIINPKNKAFKLYELAINTEGRHYLNLIEEHS